MWNKYRKFRDLNGSKHHPPTNFSSHEEFVFVFVFKWLLLLPAHRLLEYYKETVYNVFKNVAFASKLYKFLISNFKLVFCKLTCPREVWRLCDSAHIYGTGMKERKKHWIYRCSHFPWNPMMGIKIFNVC